MKKKLHEIPCVPENFNHRSAPQMRRLLFETFGLKPSSIVTEKAKEPSVKIEALEEIGEYAHPSIPILIRIVRLEQIQKMFLTGAVPEKREDSEKGLLNK